MQVSYEAIRLWCRKFGATFAAGLAAGGAGQLTNGTWTKCN